MALTTSLSLQLLSLLKVDLDLGQSRFPLSYNQRIELANGSSSNQATLLFSDQRTLAPSTSESLDLYGGLADALGNPLNFSSIKAIVISASDDNINDVVIGAGSTPFIGWFGAASHTISVKPGGLFVLVAPQTGYSVTDATADILKIKNGSSGSSVVYDIILIGT